MNKLRIFLAVISAVYSITTWACGADMGDEHLRLFVMHMPVREAIANNNLARQNSDAETLNFWYQYTNGAISKEKLAAAIKDLTFETFVNNEVAKNSLTAYLTRRMDKNALSYLRYNSELSYGTGGSGWDYHEPYTTAQWLELLTHIRQLATTGKLADRIQFLKVRCLFKLNRYNEIITLWNTKLRTIKDTALRNRIEGYVGGAYFWTKRYNHAVDIFQQQGDIRSINTVVNKMVSNTSKEAIYAHDPNSLALEYAMQDYANYYYQVAKAKRLTSGNPDDFSLYLDAGGVLQSVINDYNNTLSFAQRVLAEGKTKTPMFWAGFIGFIKWANGDADDAYRWLCKAQEMEGNEQMAYCVRLYKFMAAISMQKKPSGFDDYFLTEYRFFLENSKSIAESYQAESNETIVIPAEREMARCAFTAEITPAAIAYYAPNGGLTQLLLQGISDRYGMYGYDMGLSANYFNMLNKQYTIDQDIAVLKQYKNGGKGKVEKALIALANGKVLSEDVLNDVIGTKMIRATRFADAQKYLSNVPLSYIRSQSIAPYLARRTMPTTPFKRKVTKEYWDEESTLNQNVKFQYALKMAQKQSEVNILTGEAKAKAEYELANYLFQVSSLGDLWAVSEYSWSSYNPDSELVPHIIALLRDAEQNTKSMDLKKKIWCAMVLTPSGEKQISWDWNYNTNTFYWNYTAMATWQSDALRKLASNTTTSDPLYLSCDILRCYRNHLR